MSWTARTLRNRRSPTLARLSVLRSPMSSCSLPLPPRKRACARPSEKNAPGPIARAGGLVAEPGRGGVGSAASAYELQDSAITSLPGCLV